MERGWKLNVEISPACPRCGSCNTKFCYYNNYSLTQPRYFCKGCRRYWTKGGSLRNVPIGGGCRKSRRGKAVRLVNDTASSRNLAYRGTLGHNGRASVEFSSSGLMPNTSSIDLAVVYANFLNQQPPPQPETTLPEIPELASSGNNNQAFEFSSFPDLHIGFTAHLPLENDLGECPILSDRSSEAHFSDESGLYNSVFPSTHKHQEKYQLFTGNSEGVNHGLPPVPGEEVLAYEEMVWSDSHILVPYHMLNPTQTQQEVQDLNQIMKNRSSFDLPNFDTIFKQ